jgi:hypothetical protein
VSITPPGTYGPGGFQRQVSTGTAPFYGDVFPTALAIPQPPLPVSGVIYPNSQPGPLFAYWVATDVTLAGTLTINLISPTGVPILVDTSTPGAATDIVSGTFVLPVGWSYQFIYSNMTITTFVGFL